MLRARTSGQVVGAASGGVLRRRGGGAFPAGMAARWTLDDQAAGYVDLIDGRVLTPGGTGVTTAAGVIGDAASFGGAGRLTTPTAAPVVAQAGFAVELWVYPTAISGYLIAKDQSGVLRDWLLYQGGAGVTPIFAVWDSGGAAVELTFSLTAPLNTWTHLAVAIHTGTSGNIRAYRNGVAAGTASRASFRNVCPATGLASSPTGVTPFTGRIDEVSLWQFGAAGDPGAAFWLARYNAGAGRRP